MYVQEHMQYTLLSTLSRLNLNIGYSEKNVCLTQVVCGGSHKAFQVAWLAGWGEWERLVV